MTAMPLFNELIVSIVGGVVTALILSVFTRSRRAPSQSQRIDVGRPSRSGFGDFVHVLFAVAGGIAFTLYGGRALFAAGLLERSVPMRLVLLVAATMVLWVIIGAVRPRR